MITASTLKIHLFFYNKNNKIIVKHNNVALIEEIKKQGFKKIVYKINIYFIKNNIITTKLYKT